MSNHLRRVLMAVFAIIFCISAVTFGKSLLEYHKGNKIYDSAKEFVEEKDVSVDPETEIEDKDGNQKDEPVSHILRSYTNIDFTGLQSINSDVIGWIQILGTQVDYPLMDADDNKYYLNHTYDHSYSSYGSIFIEPRNNSDLNDNHLVVYGHNMVNKSMFGSLLNYKQQNYADNHNMITICTPHENRTYQVFSAYTAHVDSATYRMSFYNDKSFQEMVSYMKDNSVIKSSITPKAGDQILTLSTCTPAGAKDYRFVVNAVLISENKSMNDIPEKELVMTESVKTENVSDEMLTEYLTENEDKTDEPMITE